MVKPPLGECINNWEFINLLADWYQVARWEWTGNLILGGSESFAGT